MANRRVQETSPKVGKTSINLPRLHTISKHHHILGLEMSSF